MKAKSRLNPEREKLRAMFLRHRQEAKEREKMLVLWQQLVAREARYVS